MSGRAILPSEGRPLLLGIVNVTPDSFSDGGRHTRGATNEADIASAVSHGLELVAQGADALDLGGESTRPRADPVSEEVERARVVPVIAELARRTRVPLSIDTMKSGVARAALEAGATIVNDVSAGRADPEILGVTARAGAVFIAMHMRGLPRDMQTDPTYTDVVREVADFLRERCQRAEAAGVARENLWIDPGIGFGKRLEHNLALLARLPDLAALGYPICLGVSRKSFIASASGIDSKPDQRLGGTAAAIALGIAGGARILRVHDVAIMREAALVARAIAAQSTLRAARRD